MPKNDPAQLEQVSISLAFGIGSATWKSDPTDPTERNAAWELYLELVTRIVVQPLRSGPLRNVDLLG